MGPEGVGNKDVTAIAGPASEGMLVTLPADSRPIRQRGAREGVRGQERDPNGPFQMPSYAAVKIIADSIAGAKTTDPTKVAAYMHKTTFDTPIGKVAYDAQGDLKAFKFVVYTWRTRRRPPPRRSISPAHAAPVRDPDGCVLAAHLPIARPWGGPRRHRALRAATP